MSSGTPYYYTFTAVGAQGESAQSNEAYATAQTGGPGRARFYPRAGFEGRMLGGKFQGSNDGASYTDLATITATPAANQYTEQALSADPQLFRYLRYLSPSGGYCDLAELEFYSGTSTTHLTGTIFGSPGTWGNDCTRVFDGNPGTFFDAPGADGAYVGLRQAVLSPFTLTATAGTGQISLSWTSVAGVSGYNVRRSTVSGGPYTVIAPGCSGTSYTDTNVTSGTAYYYIVAALSSGGESAFSNEARAKATQTVAARGTTIIEAENYDLGGEGIAYHDVNNGGQTAYRSDNIGVYSDGGASNGFAVGWVQQGEWVGYTLNVAAAGAYALTAHLGCPASGGTFHLEFGPVGQVGGAGVIQSGEFTVPNTGSWGSYQDVTVPAVNLPAGPLWMRLVLDSGSSGSSVGNFDCFSLTPSVPAAPTNLTATAVSSSEIDLSWTASASISSYNLYRGTSSGGEMLYKTGLKNTSFGDSELTTYQAYYYQVTAVASGVESDRSAEAAAGRGISAGSGNDLGFEVPVVGGGVSQYAPSGSSWTFSSNSGISGNNSGFTSANPNAPEGAQVGFVQAMGTISQPLTSSGVGVWTVTFSAAQRGSYNSGGQTVQVLIDGAVVGTVTPAGTAYADYSVGPVSLPAGTHTLQFAGTNPLGGDNTAFLDNVRVRVDPNFTQFDTLSHFTTIRNTNWTYAGYGGMRGIGTGTLTVTGVVGTVTHAYLYWHGPTNSPEPSANATVTFAGHSIMGANIGVAADNNWNFGVSRAYRADVTSLVTGNGSYSLADFRNAVADINGVSLIIFYNGDPRHYRDVTLFDGNDSNDSLTPVNWGWNETFGSISYLGGDATLYLGVSDGQRYPEGEVDVNSSMLMPDGDNFDGDSVPNGPSADSTVGGLWDAKGYALSPFLHSGTNTLALTSRWVNDYLSLVYAIVDQPSTGATPGPLNPANLTAVAGDEQILLSWSSVAGVTYTLTRATSPAGPFHVVANGLNMFTYVDKGLMNGTTYYYVVTASDSFGTSAPSNIAQATPRAASDFRITASLGSLTVPAGGSSQSTVQLTPINDFVGAVHLTVTGDAGILGLLGDPTKISAVFIPASVGLDGTNTATSTLTLSRSYAVERELHM